MLYTIMDRTQIYLSEGQTRELDRRARERGTTRSQLIREAVEQYIGPVWDPVEFKAALRDFAGIWADRDDLDATLSDLRDSDRFARLYPDLYGSDSDPDHDADAADDRR